MIPYIIIEITLLQQLCTFRNSPVIATPCRMTSTALTA